MSTSDDIEPGAPETVVASEPRRRNGPATREAILRSARKRFAAESYEAVGLRDVAREAGVDVALVSRYFGSKDELFRKVLLERAGGEWFGGGDRAGLTAWLTDLAVGDGAGADDLERLLIILRSASSASAAAAIKASFVTDVFKPLAAMLDGPHAEDRAALALSLVVGVTVFRGIMSAEGSVADGNALSIERIRSALDGMIGAGAL